MKKPSWFRLIDFLSITFGGFLTAGVTIYAMTHHGVGPKGWQILCWLTALTFFGIWVRFSYERKKWLDTFLWYPTYGFMVQPENWRAIPDDMFDKVVKNTIDKWTPFFSAESIIKSEVNWVWFKKDLNENAMNPAKRTVKGLTIGGSHYMEVDYDAPADILEKTAFAHELGHVIMGNATGSWDQNVHHDFMRLHGLL